MNGPMIIERDWGTNLRLKSGVERIYHMLA